MAQFITRVELHSADEQDYANLHSAMEGVGFSRMIVAGTGVRYYLPTAEYNLVGNRTLADVFAAAQRAANSTGRSSWILVTQSSGNTWTLAQVR